ncbi:MAG TPA: hypothetical protein VHZ50_08160, partial [Puia sp.]|nr:hypothetical protein [Puia sp.]
RDEPAFDLNNCYQLVGKAYAKKLPSINRTVQALDCANIYLETVKRVKGLKQLVDEIEEIFN